MTSIALPTNANIIIDTNADISTDAITVVLNDTTEVATTSVKTTSSASNTLAKLIFDKQVWEANTYKTSNDQLYALLQRCYTLYASMTVSGDAARELRQAVEANLKSQGFKLSDSVHVMTKIVKCVFGADRRRVSAYGIALRAALADKVKPNDLPVYIRERGGIEELRLSQSPNAMTPKRKAEAVAQTIANTAIGTVKIKDIAVQLDAAMLGCQHVLIVTQEANGAFTINALVSSPSAVNAALAAYYSQQKPKVEAKAAEQRITTANAQRNQLIDEAAAVAFA